MTKPRESPGQSLSERVAATVAAHRDAWQAALFGASAGLPRGRVTQLVARGLLTRGRAVAGLAVPGSRHKLDPWTLAQMMGVITAQAPPEEMPAMRRWPLTVWVEAVDAEIDRRLEHADATQDGLGAPEDTQPSFTRPDLALPRASSRAPGSAAQRSGALPDAGPPSAPPSPPGSSQPPGGGGGGPLIPAPPTWLHRAEREAWIQARTRAGEYVRGLSNLVDEDYATIFAEGWDEDHVVALGDAEKRLRLRETIREKVAEAVAQRQDHETLAGILADAAADHARNWKRIAATELQAAHNEGVVVDAVRRFGPEVRIARVPESGACRSCLEAYTEGGRPRIFTARKLIENGTNVGKKQRDWKPTLWPLHPWCRCSTQVVPPGLTFDDRGRLVRDRR